jgi:hypothetical protein
MEVQSAVTYRRVPFDNPGPFAPTAPKRYSIDVLLDIGMPPLTSRFQKAESFLRQDDYACVFDLVIRNKICFRCSGPGPLYCREVLTCDDETHEHVLEGFEALCHGCSLVRRYGDTWVRGLSGVAEAHFRRVNRLSLHEARALIDEAVVLWALRSKKRWRLKLDALSAYGVNPSAYETLHLAHASNNR